jgi:type 1 glutamine amidotransferase
VKSGIQHAFALWLGALTFLFTPDSLAQTSASATNQAMVRVLIITGGHDHEAAFYSLFDGYQDLVWPAVTDAALAFKQDIRSKYDVLVFYNFTRDMDESAKKNLRDFVESGKGILVLHHGILNFQKWLWWYEEVVGGLYRLESKNGIPNSTVKFGEEHLITAAGKHPITDGLTPFRITDETYKGLFISPNIQPLLFTDNSASDRAVAWVGPCTTSKVVFIQLGHDHTPFRHPAYRALVHNSILWTAGKLN